MSKSVLAPAAQQLPHVRIPSNLSNLKGAGYRVHDRHLDKQGDAHPIDDDLRTSRHRLGSESTAPSLCGGYSSSVESMPASRLARPFLNSSCI
jgi:hypothetical protein